MEEEDDYFASNTTATDDVLDADAMGVSTDPPLHPFVAWILAMPSELFRNQVIIVKVIAFLSAMGSAYIIYSMMRRKQLDRTFNRLLLALSVSDFVSSLTFFVGSWSVPANPAPGFEDVWNTMFPQAAGNTGTCTAQGFFNYIGVTAGYLFTGCIAVSSLLQVRFRFSKKRMRFAEYFFFGVSIAFPLLTSVFILVDQGFNPNPLGYCTLYTNLSIDGVIDRGINTQRHLLIFQTIPTFFVLGIVVFCLGTLFMSVRTQEQRAKRFTMAGPANTGRNQKRVFVKSILYISGILPFDVILLVGFLAVRGMIPYNQISLMYAYAVILPIQGVLNVLIYSDFFSVFQEKTASVADSIRSSVVQTLEKFGFLSTEEASKRLSEISKRASMRSSMRRGSNPTALSTTFDALQHDEESCGKSKAMEVSKTSSLVDELLQENKGQLEELEAQDEKLRAKDKELQAKEKEIQSLKEQIQSLKEHIHCTSTSRNYIENKTQRSTELSISGRDQQPSKELRPKVSSQE